MPGFDPGAHGSQNNYLPGGTFAPACKVKEIKYDTEHLEQGVITFANNEGIAHLKIMVPNPKEPFKGKTLKETKDFLDRKFSDIIIALAKEFGILQDMPKSELTHRQCIMALAERLDKFKDIEFWVKISKNKRGYSEVGQDIPFLQRYVEGQRHTLAFTEYEQKKNLIQVQRQNVTQEDDLDSGGMNMAEPSSDFDEESNPFAADL